MFKYKKSYYIYMFKSPLYHSLKCCADRFTKKHLLKQRNSKFYSTLSIHDAFWNKIHCEMLVLLQWHIFDTLNFTSFRFSDATCILHHIENISLIFRSRAPYDSPSQPSSHLTNEPNQLAKLAKIEKLAKLAKSICQNFFAFVIIYNSFVCLFLYLPVTVSACM